MIDLQPASVDIYNSKYRLRSKSGEHIESGVMDTFSRVAHALADVEETGEKRALWYNYFFWAMKSGAIPAGRILSNAGAGEHKPNTSLINCLSGDTPVMTRSGIVPIRSLAGKTVEILNGDGDWVMAPFKSFGVQKVYPLVWRWGDNKRNTVTVKATADHRWILSGGRTVTTEYWLSGGVDGRYTIPHLRPPKIDEDEAEYCEGLVHGAIFGDGSQYKGYAHLNLCEKKREITALFSSILRAAPNHYVINGVDVDRFHIKTDINYKAIPFGCSESYLKGFFSGLLATDGSVTQSGRGCEVTVYGQLDLIEFLEERIPYIGHSPTYRRLMGKKGQITNYGTRNKDVWVLGIHPSSLEASDFVRKSQRDKHRITTNGLRTSAVWRLVSVGDEFTEEEVFCCHEPITTSFAIFNGMMTGQCVVSSTIEDSMHSILDVLKDAGLLLKAGCVAPGTMVYTEQGVVKAEEAVSGLHSRILCYDKSSKRFEMRDIQRHLVTHVPKSENIEIVSGGVSLKTSIHHPVLVYRDGSLKYVRAGDIVLDDAIVRHRFDWVADEDAALTAWFVGAHLGDGSAYERKPISYSPARKAYAERARLLGRRLVFKIRKSEQAVVEKYAQFFENFCGANARIVATETINGTPVWDYTVSSYGATKASRLIDEQTGKKCRTLKVPAWIASRPDLYFLPFLAGLIDTDGTVTQNNGSASISMTSDSFCDELKSTLGLFGVSCGVTKIKPRSHVYFGNEIKCVGGCSLKISDSDFLVNVARYMVDGKKKKRIIEHATTSGQFDRYIVPNELRDSIDRASVGLDASEKRYLGFYNGTNKKHFVSRIVLDKFERRFPEMRKQIEFARTLRKVDEINRDLDISETFYDFTVEGNNNYLAGNSGMMVIHNCGVGYCFSTLRPKGSHVAGAGAKTSGPLSFMDVYDALCKTISSAGGRRGAQMATFDIGHPDVLEFVKAKREDGRLRQFNLSLLVPDEFMATLERDGDWPLSFGGTVHRTVKARHLWDLVMASTYDYAEPGVLFVDRINEMNNLYFCEDIRATNPCVAEGTLVATSGYGYVPVESVRVGDGIVTAMGTIGYVDSIEVHDDVETFDVSLSDGSVVRATADHIFHTKDKDKLWNNETRLRDLRVGQYVRIADAAPGTMATPWLLGLSERDKGFLVGIILGDGCISPNSKNALKISVGLDQDYWLDYLKDFLSRGGIDFSEYKDKTCWVLSLINGSRKAVEEFGLSPALSQDKAFPKLHETANEDFLKGIVDGMISTDGNVHVSRLNPMVRVSSRSLELLLGLKRAMSMLGIHGRVYPAKKKNTFIEGREIKFNGQMYVLCVIGSDIKKVHNIGISHAQRSERLKNLCINYQLSGGCRSAQIKSIVPAGKCRVYDLHEPTTDTWVTDFGIVSRGCGEQALPPNGSCLLGSVDLTKFVKNPFENSAHFDFDRYRKVVAIFARMLDNVVEIANLPVKAYADELIRKRRHGMGYFGLGSAMAMLGMRYGGDRSIAFTELVTREMAHENWKQALELSLEKGPAPIMEETFKEHGGARGKELHASSRYMRKIREIDPDLREKLNRHGARFSHATSIAPTGTISLSVGNNASNGIEPSFAHEYSRNVIVEGKKSKESVKVYSLEALAWRDLHGDEPLPEHCVTTDQISPEDHIAVQAAAQRWIDSSISKCVAAGTPIITNYGVLPIEELGYASVAGEFGNALDGLEVLDADGEWKRVTSHYYDGERDTVRLWLSNGQSVEGSQVHRLLDASGNWKRLSDFDVGDGVRSRVLNGFVLAGGKSLPPCVPQAPNAKPVIFPGSMTPDLAKWIGMWCANGSANPNVVSLTDGSSEIINIWRDLSVSLFGRVTSCIVKDGRTGVFTAQIGSRALSKWLRCLAGSKAAGKFVPRQILGGSREEMLAFVSGLSLDGYRRKSHSVLYDGKSKALADGVFSMCAMLGLCPRRGEKTVSGYGYSTYYVSVKGFCGCLEDHKNTPEVSDRRHLAPLPDQWTSFHPTTDHPSYSAWRNIRQEDRAWTHPDVLERCGMDDLSGVEVLTVKRVERGCCDLYDIEVEGSHSYLIDGVISHNTINVPSDISFERFRDIYALAYKSGLKGCATFRFNPERFQGVLVKEDDLKNTVYRFDLENGDSVEFRGDETVEYEGEQHTAANLFDAIKEGYYGKL